MTNHENSRRIGLNNRIAYYILNMFHVYPDGVYTLTEIQTQTVKNAIKTRNESTPIDPGTVVSGLSGLKAVGLLESDDNANWRMTSGYKKMINETGSTLSPNDVANRLWYSHGDQSFKVIDDPQEDAA